MATETQKNFRKQMKELEKETKHMEAPETYSYIHKDFVSSKVKYRRRKVITLSGILTFLALGLYLYTNAAGLTSMFSGRNQGEVVSYIESMDAIESSFEKVMDRLDINLSALDTDTKANSQALVDLGGCKSEIQTVIEDLKDLKTPEDLKKLKQSNLNRYNYTALAIDAYIRGYTNRSSADIDQGDSYLDKYDAENELQNQILISIFKKYSIEYKVESDGSITYWYNDISGDED